ncbi:type I DNA topoisomerase [Patescibacteria group bacterium]|nr:type I DNA topoisomerase [Patescibacteria group bacterium]MBU4458607.1 type I DNA topoisomerase [Patescibacteria group bacterium]MCG2696256.1 type I DNA topoisomerase [Candidatus Portnoybacteria bacterium]
MNLIIVESPTKAKTIKQFLGKGFEVESSFGHMRDLPQKELAIDVENNFEPNYVIIPKAKKVVAALKEKAKKSQEVILATDEDREGEAIAWHLTQALKLKNPKRIVFHEITKTAIEEALKNPRNINMNLVDAQQARRILDRLVGYKLSPLLWKKVARGLSAGRVQSIVVRLIVEREKEIQDFKIEEYWEISGDFKTPRNENFSAKLQKIDNKVIDKLEIKSRKEAEALLEILSKKDYYIADIVKKEITRNPLPPFTTSTLQQEANRKLGFSAKQTMITAQQLYEMGFITYMRTDSLNLSQKFISEAANYIKTNLGNNYLETRNFKTKNKTAQEAHEAVRPTEINRTPEQLKNTSNKTHFKLYQLIWQRAISSQMSSAKIDATSVDINNKDDKYTFKINGQIIKFDGFLKFYPTSAKEEILPEMKKGEDVNCIKLNPMQKFTQPPARYSDATLVKTLEEKGIGRPSTYAPTISTVIERGYAMRTENKRLKPTDIAFVVNNLLMEHFSNIVDYDFTAKMENDLDEIADGKQQWQETLKTFYKPFSQNLEIKQKELNKKEITEEKTDKICEKCGKPMIIKIGKFGKFLACSNYPTCKNTKKLDINGEEIIKEKPQILDEKCPECGANLVIRHGRYGSFKGCSKYPTCKYIKKEEQKDLNLKCPKCETGLPAGRQGKITIKRSRKGIFYGCDQYPKCDFAFWGKPLPGKQAGTYEKCPNCGFPLVKTQKDKVKCSNKDCDFIK